MVPWQAYRPRRPCGKIDLWTAQTGQQGGQGSLDAAGRQQQLVTIQQQPALEWQGFRDKRFGSITAAVLCIAASCRRRIHPHCISLLHQTLHFDCYSSVDCSIAIPAATSSNGDPLYFRSCHCATADSTLGLLSHVRVEGYLLASVTRERGNAG